MNISVKKLKTENCIRIYTYIYTHIYIDTYHKYKLTTYDEDFT